jgi:acetyltransferase-like isoleucine patch superfamily enzyme
MINDPEKIRHSKVILDLLEQCDDVERVDFLERFLSVFALLHERKLEKFSRSLPLAEYFVDRWERAKLLGFSEGVSIYDSAVVIGDVSIGRSTWIGPNVLLDGSGKLEIGSFCSISANVQIYSHDSVNWANSGGVEPYEYKSTVIGSNCYIGPNVVIQKGVSIGDGVVVGANSFVNKDIEKSTKVAGNPAKRIL